MSQHKGGTAGAVVGWVLQTSGWSQGRLAKAIGVTQPWVSQVLAGKVSPKFADIVEMLAQTGCELLLVESDTTGDGGSMHRRQFLIDIGAVAGLAHVGAAVPLGTGALDLRDAETIAALTRRYVAMEQQLGGATIFAPAARVAQSLRRQINTDDAMGPAYHQAAGWFMHEVAWLAYDSGRRPQADSYATDASRLAERTGDRRLRARALNLLSLSRAAAGDGLGAAELARRGISAAQADEAATERTLVWARLARAEAIRGRESVAMDALGHAQETAIDGRGTYEVVANRGIVLAKLGHFSQARPWLAQAADIIGRMGEPRNRGIYLAREAKVAIREDELDQAASLVAQLLNEAGNITSDRIDSHLHEWMALTAPLRISSDPSIRTARARIRDHLIAPTTA